jgi:hypothetical protein
MLCAKEEQRVAQIFTTPSNPPASTTPSSDAQLLEVELCERLQQVLLKGSARLSFLSNASVLMNIQKSVVTRGEDIADVAMIAGRAALGSKIWLVHHAVCYYLSASVNIFTPFDERATTSSSALHFKISLCSNTSYT